MTVTRCVLRWGLISGLALGGMTLLVGPERMSAGLSQVRGNLQNVVDQAVDNPVALRRQLESLAAEYPERIAEVAGELAEVDHQIAEIERDIDIATKVVALATDDLGTLKRKIELAERTQVESGAQAVFFRFAGSRYDIDRGLAEANRVLNVRDSYGDRMAYDQQQLGFLYEQRERLADIQTELQAEFNTFEGQMLALDRQIDAIERNDRLIELTERQRATLNSYDKFAKVGNLHQLEGKLAELRRVQEAQLQVLADRGVHRDYERAAIIELDGDATEIEINDRFDEITTGTSNSVAWSGPIIVELDDE